jgi:hypothetical protein
MDGSLLSYGAISALGTWAAVLCALFVVWSQNRSGQRLTSLQLFIQLAAQYGSAEMHEARRRIAKLLLDDPKTLEVEESLLIYFENVAILSRKRLLDRDLMWNTFVYDVPRYWHLLRDYILYARAVGNNPAMYEEFEHLAKELSSRACSPLGTKLPSLELTEESLRDFLLYESRIGGGQSSCLTTPSTGPASSSL